MNNSGFIPKGFRILVKPLSVEETLKTTESGIIISNTAKGREEQAQIVGTLIEVGEHVWPDGKWAEVGDKVVFGKYSGILWQGQDDEKYRILNDTDILGIIK